MSLLRASPLTSLLQSLPVCHKCKAHLLAGAKLPPSGRASSAAAESPLRELSGVENTHSQSAAEAASLTAPPNPLFLATSASVCPPTTPAAQLTLPRSSQQQPHGEKRSWPETRKNSVPFTKISRPALEARTRNSYCRPYGAMQIILPYISEMLPSLSSANSAVVPSTPTIWSLALLK